VNCEDKRKKYKLTLGISSTIACSSTEPSPFSSTIADKPANVRSIADFLASGAAGSLYFQICALGLLDRSEYTEYTDLPGGP
jgi:hypothetical protein